MNEKKREGLTVKFCAQCGNDDFKLFHYRGSFIVRCRHCLFQPGPPYQGAFTFSETLDVLPGVVVLSKIEERICKELDQLQKISGGLS